MFIGVGAGESTVTTRSHDVWVPKRRDGAPHARTQRLSSSEEEIVVSARHASHGIDPACLGPLVTKLSDIGLGLVRVLTMTLAHTFAKVLHRAQSQLLTSPKLPVCTIAVAKEGKRRGELDHPPH